VDKLINKYQNNIKDLTNFQSILKELDISPEILQNIDENISSFIETNDEIFNAIPEIVKKELTESVNEIVKKETNKIKNEIKLSELDKTVTKKINKINHLINNIIFESDFEIDNQELLETNKLLKKQNETNENQINIIRNEFKKYKTIQEAAKHIELFNRDKFINIANNIQYDMNFNNNIKNIIEKFN